MGIRIKDEAKKKLKKKKDKNKKECLQEPIVAIYHPWSHTVNSV